MSGRVYSARVLFVSAMFAAACVAVGLLAAAMTLIDATTQTAQAEFTPTDPPNSPAGVARGIHPGRVVWVHDPDAAGEHEDAPPNHLGTNAADRVEQDEETTAIDESQPWNLIEQDSKVQTFTRTRGWLGRGRSTSRPADLGRTKGNRQGDPRTEGLRVIDLGPNSILYLYDPVVGDVRLVSSVENLGPDTMTYLKFYNLYPGNLDRQEIIDIQFYPEGGEFIEDDRGQPIVYYYFTGVAPGTKHETWWRARVRTWEMIYDIALEDVGTLDEIPPEIASEFLADDPLFDITNPIVTNARDEAIQGETHPLLMAHLIYDWVQANLYYLGDDQWDDAPTVIQNGHGSCSEYAFVFIALCRSAGIPARWTGSIVRRGSAEGPGPYQDDPHHRWAEAYLPNIGWMQCNVQGGTWGYLPNRYLVISQSSGPSNYLHTRYDSYRYWSYGGGSGDTDRERYGLWYSDLDSFYPMAPHSGSNVWPYDELATVQWDILGEIAPDESLTMNLNYLGETVWTSDELDPLQGLVDIPVSSLFQTGPHFDLVLNRSDIPALAGYLFPVEIRDDQDADGLDDHWENYHWGNLNAAAEDDPDGDGASNLCEYYGMTDPTRMTLYASDMQELGGAVGFGVIGHNEYGCGLTGKIEVNGIAWDKSLGVHADSWIEYEVPDGVDMFRGMYALEDHNGGKVVFECYVNNTLVFTSGTVTKPYGQLSFPVFVEVAVQPGDHIMLVTDSLFDVSHDHSCWLQPALVRTSQLPGDLDGNGSVDLDDLAVFIEVLLGVDAIPKHIAIADMNGSGTADGLDVQPFIDAFLGPRLRGDLDDNGEVNTEDIPLFVLVLLDPTTYPDLIAVADMNYDGTANGLDIQPFVNLLIGN